MTYLKDKSGIKLNFIFTKTSKALFFTFLWSSNNVTKTGTKIGKLPSGVCTKPKTKFLILNWKYFFYWNIYPAVCSSILLVKPDDKIRWSCIKIPSILLIFNITILKEILKEIKIEFPGNLVKFILNS